MSEIELSSSPSKQYNTLSAKKKEPKRILHFSDGIIEEYSTDEEEEEQKREEERKSKQIADPKTMSWPAWLFYLGWVIGSTTLSTCDNVGEKLAWWFGITSPKYYYEIEEARRMNEEEEERKQRQDAEMAGWSQDGEQKKVVESQLEPTIDTNEERY